MSYLFSFAFLKRAMLLCHSARPVQYCKIINECIVHMHNTHMLECMYAVLACIHAHVYTMLYHLLTLKCTWLRPYLIHISTISFPLFLNFENYVSWAEFYHLPGEWSLGFTNHYKLMLHKLTSSFIKCSPR